MKPILALLLALGAALGSMAASADTSSEAAEQRAVLADLDRLSAAGKLQSDDGKALRTGEALRWHETSLNERLTIDTLVQTSPVRAVARLPAGQSLQDTYIYLEKVGDRWKVSAARTLALTGPIREVIADLENNVAVRDREFLLRNFRLTLETDAELKAWFETHKASLEALRNDYLAARTKEYWRIAEREDKGSPLSDRLRALGLIGIGYAESGGIEIMIGGVVDNSVGFLFVGEQAPPPMSDDNYIWVEPIGDGWCLFRTT
jgi:hypothetical protein